MALSQPRGVIEIGELGEPLAQRLYGREVPDPEQLLLQRLDDPLRDTVALWLTHEGGSALDPEEFDLVLEFINHVSRAMVVAKDQTGRDVFLHRT
jgi:hypothetical protein